MSSFSASATKEIAGKVEALQHDIAQSIEVLGQITVAINALRPALTVEKLKTRFVMLLRQTEFGDRRRHDRLPCDLAIPVFRKHWGCVSHRL